jgi:hypothetical protein
MEIRSLEDQKCPKNANMGILGWQGDTYAVVGLPSNLVSDTFYNCDLWHLAVTLLRILWHGIIFNSFHFPFNFKISSCKDGISNLEKLMDSFIVLIFRVYNSRSLSSNVRSCVWNRSWILILFCTCDLPRSTNMWSCMIYFYRQLVMIKIQFCT